MGNDSYLSNTNPKQHLEQKHQFLVNELMVLDQSQTNKTRRTKNTRAKTDKKDLAFIHQQQQENTLLEEKSVII